jgi:hypothetical protein
LLVIDSEEPEKRVTMSSTEAGAEARTALVSASTKGAARAETARVAMEKMLENFILKVVWWLLVKREDV